MKILLKLETDNYNTDPYEELELMEYGDHVYLTLGNREISVDKSDILAALKILCEK